MNRLNLDVVGREVSPSMETIVEHLMKITAVVDDRKKDDRVKREWQTLAKVFDRLFFVAFFFIFLLSSLILLMPIWHGY